MSAVIGVVHISHRNDRCTLTIEVIPDKGNRKIRYASGGTQHEAAVNALAAIGEEFTLANSDNLLMLTQRVILNTSV